MKEDVIKRKEVTIDIIDTGKTNEKNVSLSILRLDKIHPVVSGNKLFKLHYFLNDAINSLHKTIITFGGAYSNHLAATAFAGNEYGLKTIGIVRGEKPVTLSHTLQFCLQQKMQLEFISRHDYEKKDDSFFLNTLQQKFGQHILIPEGGFNSQGIKGAAIIADYFKEKDYTHICCAVGTATTFAGVATSTKKTQQVVGFSALKNMDDFENRMEKLSVTHLLKNYDLINDYHFGGYAKKNDRLISYMNNFFSLHLIPLDFVYTAKMMFGVEDLINKNYFAPQSKILCIHTGGLQGNYSLPERVLNF
jgi:1-aminocyclopropane-1-carboxylate deaminase/D-cysteine desulfhydrase-like pyridoxal-dependent ACC family enzyme